MQNERLSERRTWRLIVITAFVAAVCWWASVAMVRAFAQQVPAEPDTNEAEEGQRRTPPPKLSDEESPEFRDSADNNISLPVDI